MTTPFDRKRRYRKKKTSIEDVSIDWQVLCERISNGKVIPIISNTVRNDCIFDINYDGSYGLPQDEAADHEPVDQPTESQTISQGLARMWAEEIGYPLPDGYHLARVADYNRRMNSVDDEDAKRKYLAFLKRALVWVAEDDKAVSKKVESLKPDDLSEVGIADMDDEQVIALENHLSGLMFSDIARRLKYPKFNGKYKDPLQFLAGLPLPLYLTTSSHDFMERALYSAGKKNYRTKICFWFGEPIDLAEEHKPTPNLDLDPEKPIVCHLFGFEQYPKSLVLSEDDYLDFLVRVVEESSDQEDTILPHALTTAIRQSSVLLLGYRLQDWEFRVLFRGILRDAAKLGGYKLVIQLDPHKQTEIKGKKDENPAHKYLRKYFAPFQVDWGTTEMFMDKLEQEWNIYRSN